MMSFYNKIKINLLSKAKLNYQPDAIDKEILD